MKAKLTICIPAYNVNQLYIKRAIKSVENQSSNNWQLYVVDGSDIQDIALKQYVDSLQNKKIQYLRNEKDRSMAGNWNYSFDHAKSELVTLLHDDDYLSPKYVENMLEVAEEFDGSAAYFCDVSIVNEHNRRAFSVADFIKRFIKPRGCIIHLSGDEGLASILNGCYIFCPTICYRKSKLSYSPFSNKWKMVTDLKFYLDVLSEQSVITGINQKLYFYRRHKQNQTSKMTESLDRFKEESDLYDVIASLPLKDWPKSISKASKKRIIKLHLWYRVFKSVINFDISKARRQLMFARNISRMS